MTNFSDFSLDVLLHIFSFLPPRDIILGARQVCLNFNHASINLSLWKTLLRRVCFENTLLSSSFPNRMSLKDLEHAATSPSRFISKLRSCSERGVPLEVYAKNYIDIDYLMNEEMPNFSETVSQLYLIPGGRFLLTQQVTADGSTDEIHLWDLGIPGDPEGIPLGRLPIASLNDRAFVVPQPAHSTCDGKGILVFACKDNARDDRDKCQRDIVIYEIYPTLEAPSFRQIGIHGIILEDDQSLPTCSFNCGKVVMLVDNIRIYVWDFIANTEATWTALVNGIDGHDIFLRGDFVVLLCSDSVSIFNIPDLYPCGSTLANNIQSLDPCFCSDIHIINHPLAIQFNVEALGAWYSGSSQSIYIDSVVSRADDGVSTTRYRLDISSALDNNITKSPSSLLPIITVDFNTACDDGNREEYRVSDDHIILYWSSARGLTIQSAPLGISYTPGGLGPSQPLITVHRSPYIHRNLVSLCPASGRAVSCEYDRYLIEIMDFLPHPSATGEPLAPYESDSD